MRARWSPPGDAARTTLRRAHAAWCNAGIEGNPLSWSRAQALLLPAGSMPRGASGATGGQERPAGTEPLRGAPDPVGAEPSVGPRHPGGAEPPVPRAHLELIGCLRALEFMESWNGRLSLGLVRHLHGILMSGLCREPGCLRRGQVRIVRETGPEAGQTVFEPPHWAQVTHLLEALLEFLPRPQDPFLKSGLFHYEFQSIHPFEDGNGRLGRLLSGWLARQGWDSRGFYLEPGIARAGPAYYLALRSVRSDYRGEVDRKLNSWLLPYFDMVEEALLHPDPLEEAADA